MLLSRRQISASMRTLSRGVRARVAFGACASLSSGRSLACLAACQPCSSKTAPQTSALQVALHTGRKDIVGKGPAGNAGNAAEGKRRRGKPVAEPGRWQMGGQSRSLEAGNQSVNHVPGRMHPLVFSLPKVLLKLWQSSGFGLVGAAAMKTLVLMFRATVWPASSLGVGAEHWRCW